MTPWIVAHQASLSITNSRSLLKLMFIELVIPSNHLILCRPLILTPSIFPSIRVFLSESLLRIRWPKYWSFSFNISPSNEHSGLISCRINWLDLLAVQGTLKNLLQISPTRRCKSCQYLCSQFVRLVAKSCPILCCQHVCVLVAQLCPTLVTPWTVARQVSLSMGFSSKNTGVDCHSFLQRNFPTQGTNLGLLHCRQVLYHLSYRAHNYIK